MRCDFCGCDLVPGLDSVVTFRGEKMVVQMKAGDVTVNHVLAPNWAACKACACLLIVSDYQGVVDRLQARTPDTPMPRDLAWTLCEVYSRLEMADAISV